jgi:hypothetical protein
MKVSKLDPCLFVGDRVMDVAFMEDILFWSTDRRPTSMNLARSCERKDCCSSKKMMLLVFWVSK